MLMFVGVMSRVQAYVQEFGKSDTVRVDISSNPLKKTVSRDRRRDQSRNRPQFPSASHMQNARARRIPT